MTETTGTLHARSVRVPEELRTLEARIEELPATYRRDLEPLVAQAIEDAQYRDRALSLARDALAQLRLDLATLRFDLEVTRQEREQLRATRRS